MVTSSIFELCTRLNNNILNRRKVCTVSRTGLNYRILKLLVNKGYISYFRYYNSKIYEVYIAYTGFNNSVVRAFRPYSTFRNPACVKYRDLKKMANFDLILSTQLGLLTNSEAIEKKIGGVVLFFV